MPGKTTIPCESCNAPIQTYPSRVGRKRFCSRACHDVAQRLRRGEDAAAWKGGIQHSNGYLYEHRPDHPHAGGNGRVAQHRLVAERREGRYLTPDEVVHHIDGNRTNNHPDNLLVLSPEEHTRLHSKGTANRRARLTEDQVREIRQRVADGERTAILATEFGVANQTISAITTGKNWKHL